MADNTTLPTGGGGDTIRTLDRTGTGSPKTEVVQLDLGGGDGRPENLVSSPLPTALVEVPLDDDGYPIFNPAAPSADISTESLQRQILFAIYGPAGTAAAPASVSVGVSSVQIVAANPGRKGLYLTNISTTSQRIALSMNGNAAVLDTGIVLYAGNFFWMDRYSFTTAAINAIGSAASGVLSVQEFS